MKKNMKRNMKKWIVGNWKMHGNPAMTQALAHAVAEKALHCTHAEVVICPPHIWLAEAKQAIAGGALHHPVHLGGQDCHPQAEGAYTGDTSAIMLKEAGCRYVIVGHSERRAAYGESDDLVRSKAASAQLAGLIPIVCVGETLAQREKGMAEPVVSQQVQASIPEGAGNFLLAYEPVWAIGSGKTPTVDDISQMHRHIVSVASERTGRAPEAVAVLYGGSVKAANAAAIMKTQAVSGVLVGGASLKADEFCGIMAAA